MLTFNNEVLLITGGIGSYDSAVLRCFLDSDVKKSKQCKRPKMTY